MVRTEDHSSKVVADRCSICVLVSFIRRGWAEPGGWGRHYGTRIGLALFLFPPFYLSCHYVSSAVFNDGSSLQAVSGCTTVGGGGNGGRGTVFYFFLCLIVFKRPKRARQMPQIRTFVIM